MALKLSDLNPTDVQLVAPAPGGGAGPAPGAPPLRLSDLAASDVQVMPAAADVSGTEAALRGGLQGATLGFGDELEGAGRAVLEKLLSSHPDRSLAELYRAHRDYARAQNDAARQAHPYIYGAGNIAGGIAPALLTGGGSTAAEMIGGGAALGAAAGLGSSNADLTQGDVGQAAMDTATGAAMGGAGGALAAGAGAAIKSAAPAVSGSLRGSAEDLAVKATGATGKQAADFAPDAGRQLLDRGIVKFGSDPAAIAENAGAQLEKSAQGISGSLAQLDEQGAGVPTSGIIQSLRSRAAALGKDPSKFSESDAIKRLADRLEAQAAGRTPPAPAPLSAEVFPSSQVQEQLPLPGHALEDVYPKPKLNLSPDDLEPKDWARLKHLKDPDAMIDFLRQHDLEEAADQLEHQWSMPTQVASGPEVPGLAPGRSFSVDASQPALPLPVPAPKPDMVPLTAAEQTKRGFQASVNYNSSPAETSVAKEAADVYRQAVEDAATKADPAIGAQFQADKQNYGLLKPVVDASEKRALQLQQSPHGGLLDMTAAAGGAGVGTLLGGPAGAAIGGLAGLAAKTLRPRYASMGAVTTDWLAKSVAQAPQAFGKYAAPLANAAARGPAALAATHYVLQQTDPEYREKIDSFRGPAEGGDQ